VRSVRPRERFRFAAGLVQRLANTLAFERRCIRSSFVALVRRTLQVRLHLRALLARRIDALDASGYLRDAVLVVALLAVFPLSGCEKLDRNMYDNPAFRSQEEPVRLPPAGSVPTKGLDHTPKPGTPEAAALRNWGKVTDFSLLTGKELYGIYCTPCHGESGKGDGPVAKKFVPTPVDISATGHGSHHPEGDLFAVVTHGKNGMPPFRSDLTAEERWLVVAYLRTLK